MRQRTYAGCPELYLKVPAPDSGEIDTDALSCALSRAEAICLLIAGYYDEEDLGKWNDSIMRNAFWALEGCINQAQLLVSGDNSSTRQGDSHLVSTPGQIIANPDEALRDQSKASIQPTE